MAHLRYELECSEPVTISQQMQPEANMKNAMLKSFQKAKRYHPLFFNVLSFRIELNLIL